MRTFAYNIPFPAKLSLEVADLYNTKSTLSIGCLDMIVKPASTIRIAVRGGEGAWTKYLKPTVFAALTSFVGLFDHAVNNSWKQIMSKGSILLANRANLGLL